jgi:hypothetical protein
LSKTVETPETPETKTHVFSVENELFFNLAWKLSQLVRGISTQSRNAEESQTTRLTHRRQRNIVTANAPTLIMRRTSQLFFRAFIAVAVATASAMLVLWPQITGNDKNYDRGGLTFVVCMLVLGNAGLLVAAIWARRKESGLPKTYRIPIETAHRFLAAFGITRPTKDYDRWVKEDGFDLGDFPTVLSDSPFIFIIDWRANMADELPRIVEGLAKLGVSLKIEVDEVSSTAFIGTGEEKVLVKYVPSDEDDFTDTIVAVQTIVPPTIEFRKSPYNGQMDSWNFAVLPRDEWEDLETLDGAVLRNLYLPLSAATN